MRVQASSGGVAVHATSSRFAVAVAVSASARAAASARRASARLESRVARGENEGTTLRHVWVARAMAATAVAGGVATARALLPELDGLAPGAHVIAWAQRTRGLAVLGTIRLLEAPMRAQRFTASDSGEAPEDPNRRT